MDNEKEIKEFEKARWKSRKVILMQAMLFVVASFLFWIIAKFVSIPVWVTVIVLGLLAFTLFGGIINCIYCNQKLKTLRSK